MIDPGRPAKSVDDQKAPDGPPVPPVPRASAESKPVRPDDGADQTPEESAEVAVRALKRSLGHPFRVGFVLGGLVALAAALLVIQNGESAQIRWLWADFSAPLWVVLLLTLVAGGLVWETARMALRRGRRLRRERREALERLRADTTS